MDGADLLLELNSEQQDPASYQDASPSQSPLRADAEPEAELETDLEA